MALAGCSTPPDSSGETGPTELVRGAVNQPAAPGTPAAGGTLRILDYNANDNLDPATTTNGGNTDSVRAAIYDTLVRYDYEKNEWAPQLAESLTPSAAGDVWTLTLRENVNFTDGTPLDAQSVVDHIKRKAASAQNFQKALLDMVTGFETPDPRTVVFTLAVPWTEFPYLLASDAGSITSPTAVAARGERFSQNPVGAGPFKVSEFIPGQKVTLVRNDDYWDGTPQLDGVVFQAAGSGSLSIDQLKTGAADMIHVQSADPVITAANGGNPGWIFKSDAGMGLQTNVARTPASDEGVRQAIAHAIDYDALSNRVAPDSGLFGSSLMASDSLLASSTSGLSYDPEKAKALVEDAKSRLNWDGSLTYAALPDPSPYAQTIRAMLDAVGFKVDLVQSTDANLHVQRVYVKKDFDIADSSLNLWDFSPWTTFTAGLGLAGSFGFDSTELSAEVSALRTAQDPAAKKAAIDAVQGRWNQQQPFIVTGARPFGFFWSDSVHGVVPNSAATVLLGKAFIAK